MLPQVATDGGFRQTIGMLEPADTQRMTPRQISRPARRFLVNGAESGIRPQKSWSHFIFSTQQWFNFCVDAAANSRFFVMDMVFV